MLMEPQTAIILFALGIPITILFMVFLIWLETPTKEK